MNPHPLNHCEWCGIDAPPETQMSQDGWRCSRCQRVTKHASPGDASQVCGSCGEAYFGYAHYCPACGTVSATEPPSELQTKYGLLPSPMQPIWPTKSWWEEDGCGLVAPPCPACGEKLRPDGAGSHQHIGCAFPPWNAGWDGRCASCGHLIAAIVEQQTHQTTKRVVTMHPAESFHQTFIDEGIVFSGVRIRVEESEYHDQSPRVSEVFLSMGELTTLLRSLESKANPMLQQFDWTCDWT
jgi:hypothetical protein